MKIISQPNVSNWFYHHTCIDCGVVLEVEANDLHHHHSDGEGVYPPSDSYSANCPVCHRYFTVREALIPKALQVKLQTKSKIE